MNTPSANLVVPTENDIILGRGTAHSRHPGNVRMYTLVQSYRDLYEKSANRCKKSYLIVTITNELLRSGRFVRLAEVSTGLCVECSYREARQKVGHAMRYCIEKKSKIRAKAPTAVAGANAPASLDLSTNSVELFTDAVLESVLGPREFSDSFSYGLERWDELDAI